MFRFLNIGIKNLHVASKFSFGVTFFHCNLLELNFCIENFFIPHHSYTSETIKTLKSKTTSHLKEDVATMALMFVIGH